jgi:hypothetical protein
MGGHSLHRRSGFVQEARDGQVSGGALAWQQVLVDGRLHDRMNEAEERVVGEHARPDEEIRDRSRLLRVNIGHLRRDADIGLSAEHATARASDVAEGPSRSNRRRTNRPTARGPTSLTVPAAALVGATSASDSAATSSRRKRGFPPVAPWQARQNSPAASSPSRPRTTTPAPASVSGWGPRTWAAGSSASSRQRPVPSGSAGRPAATSRTGKPSRRRER